MGQLWSRQISRTPHNTSLTLNLAIDSILVIEPLLNLHLVTHAQRIKSLRLALDCDEPTLLTKSFALFSDPKGEYKGDFHFGRW